MSKVRLQRILARAGVASRRAAEQLIVEGRVRIGTRVVTELGTKADPRREHIFVNGRRVMAEKLVYVLLHKPRGVVCTLSDPEGRTTVTDLLHGVEERVVPVGRIDFETSGVLLLTNDGDFAAALAHPRRKAPKVYIAKVNGAVGEEELARWQQPIQIDDKWTQPADVRVLRHENDKAWLEITLREGKNRHIHRLGEFARSPVMRLARVEYAGLNCDGLRPGMWRYLTVKELTALKGSYGVPKVVRPPPEAQDSKQERIRNKPWRRPRGAGQQASGAWGGTTRSSDEVSREREVDDHESFARASRAPANQDLARKRGAPSSDERKPFARKSTSVRSDERQGFGRKPSAPSSDERKPFARKSTSARLDERQGFGRKPSTSKSDERQPFARKPTNARAGERPGFGRKPSPSKSDERQPFARKPTSARAGERPGFGRKPSASKSDERQPIARKSTSARSDERRPSTRRATSARVDEREVRGASRSDERKPPTRRAASPRSNEREAVGRNPRTARSDERKPIDRKSVSRPGGNRSERSTRGRGAR